VFDTTYWTAYTDTRKTYRTITVYKQPSSEDVSWSSKHVEDTKIINLKY